MGVIQKGLIQRISSGGGGATIAATTNLLVGDGAGNASAAGAGNITSNSASALTVGANGSTNPALKVDASAASSVTGLQIKSGQAGVGVAVSVISSFTDEPLTFNGKGQGDLNFNGGLNNNFKTLGSIRLQVSSFNYDFSGLAALGTTTPKWRFVAPSGDLNITASTEATTYYINNGVTRQYATGALTAHRDTRVTPCTLSAVGASTITNAMGFSVDGAVTASTNATITNSHSIYSGGSNVGSGVVNSYAINLTANTGATNNYCTSYNGTAGEIFRVRTDGQIKLLATNTAGGTTGNQTINKPSGTVNIAAAGTTVTVTNALCTTSSIVFAVVRTNDTTALIKNVVPGAGSFVITMNAAVTAETSIGFFIIN